MTNGNLITPGEIAVQLDGLCKSFGAIGAREALALDQMTATIRTGGITGLVGPDGAGKTTLMRLIAGLMLPSRGQIQVFGLDSVKETAAMQEAISYMPQRFGLYEDLSVQENLNLYADLHDVIGQTKRDAFAKLLTFTSLQGFTTRLAGNLSGGMKQKLGVACALVEKPRLLLLDEPSVGVDPISRRELWQLVKDLVDDQMAVVWSTAYLDEAERCDTVLLLNQGKLLFNGPPAQLTARVEGRTFRITDFQGEKRKVLSAVLREPNVIDGVLQGNSIRVVARNAEQPPEIPPVAKGGSIQPVPPRFEDAFIDILGGGPGGYSALAANIANQSPPKQDAPTTYLIEANALTKQFGNFTAARNITFSIRSGEIFGLLGPNGAGKSTTFKMMCGLLKPTSGTAKVAGLSLQKAPGQARSRIGYMAQKFSLYGNLSALQNLSFFSGVYGLSGHKKRQAIQNMIQTFALQPYLDEKADALPLGFKQRLALACAVMHQPEVLFLDEPTSGVDPITRREFWTHINGMVENGVTVMVTTHFMEEAEYCDRIALVYGGQIIAMGDPDQLRQQARTEELPEPTMEEAFIALIQAVEEKPTHTGAA